MLKHLRLILFVSVILIRVPAEAQNQNLCPTGVASDKLICLIPQVYGENGLVLPNLGSTNPVVTPHFQNILTDSLRPLNSGISRQAALLPLASPSSGITSAWDANVKAWVPTTDSLGPILGERAETIGKHRVFLGFSYQYFNFDSLDGHDLKKLPAMFTQPDDPNAVSGRVCSIAPKDTPSNEGPCGFIRDVIVTNTRVDFKIHQFTTFVTFGLTNQIDVSVAIPVENVRMGAVSTATVIANSKTDLHQFLPNCNTPCFTASFPPNVRTASGVGDMTFRVKGMAWKGERAALALGVDIRVPTGDTLNFMGSGAAGVKPFVVWSYQSRISPHVLVGYETNGSSVLAGDISTGKKDKLPSQLTYSGGVDVWITKRLTTAFDLVGQQVFQARRLTVTDVMEPGACEDGFCGECPPTPTVPCSTKFAAATSTPSISQMTGAYNMTNASIGLKIRPVSALLITGNVMIKLNDGGLRAHVIPLIGISYTF